MDKTEYIPKIKVSPKNADTEALAVQTQRIVDETIRIHIDADTAKTRDTKIPSAYALLHKIGEGGMGIVYLAFENGLGRHVAIKRLKSAMSHRASFLKRFFREAKAIAALSHSHIVHIYALGEDPDEPYIVMEYVEGPAATSTNDLPAPPCTLTDRIAHEGPMPVGEALDLAIKLCQAVGYAHSRGVIHRDLKPANILFDKSGEPKIVDFGLARRLGPSEEQLTRPGERMLSMGYGAPEQESGIATIDERADIYGLGAILFYCITGENPRYFRPNSVPEQLRDVLVKALDTDRDKRWASARDFEQRLTLVHAPSSIEFPTTRAIWRCKWCQASNPAIIRYCEACGWDGMEYCLECGAETRIGIQFCGRCGADARDYEIVWQLLKKLQAKWNDKDYEFIIRHAGQISGFQPVGPAGQTIIDDIGRLKQKAHSVIRRLESIRQSVPSEIEQKNFQVVRKLIEEYNTLARDHAFVETTERLPALMLDREIGRIKSAVAKRDWTYAARLARHALDTLAPSHPDLRRLLRHARIAPWWNAVRNTAVGLAVLLTVYLLSAAPIQRFTQGPSERMATVFSMAAWIHNESFLRRPLRFYASLWGPGSIPTLEEAASDDTRASGNTKHASNALATLQAQYNKTLFKIETQHLREDRQRGDDYFESLRQIQSAMQEDGDFAGWLAVKSGMDRFHEESDIHEDDIVDEPVELRQLQMLELKTRADRTADRQRDISKIVKTHVQNLETLRKELTQQGQMDEAARVNEEIKRMKAGL